VPEGYSAESFASTMLDHAAVSLTPGTVFGANGEGFVRISLTAPIERIEEAMQRMSQLLQKSGANEL
jgi:LL-diaminopimelate aminotransferase